RMRYPPEIRGRSRIDPGLRRISSRQRKWPHTKPLRTQVFLVCARIREAVLIPAVNDLKPLPVVDIHDGMPISVADPFIGRKQWPVNIDVATLVGGIIRVCGNRVWVSRHIRLPRAV